jgi:hypothetical protein
MKNRKAAEAFILKYIEKLAPNTQNADTYRDIFSKMSDKEFDAYMEDLNSGKKTLTITAPNFTTKISLTSVIDTAKELGLDFFHQLWMGESKDTPAYLTPEKYMVLDLPVFRPSQTLVKKRSIP